ncbi:hypothetical protein RFI_13114, partial [Reticulomyxa filosa]
MYLFLNDYQYDYNFMHKFYWNMPLTTAWSKIVYEAHTNDQKNRVCSLSALSSSLAKVSSSFGDGSQQDAFDVMSVLLSQLELALLGNQSLRTFKKTYRETKMESMKEEEELTIGKELYEVMTEQTNKIGQIFDGMEVNTMQCEHCGHCLRVFERFRYLVCPVVSRNQVLPIICIHNDFLTFEKLMPEAPSTMAIDKLKDIIAGKTEYYKEHISRKRENWYIGSISEKVKAQTQMGSESTLELDIRRIPDDMEIGQLYKRRIFAIYYPEYNSRLFDVLCVEVKIDENDKFDKHARMKNKYTGKKLMDILAEKYKESNWHVFKIFMDNKLLHEHSTIQLPITTHLLI